MNYRQRILIGARDLFYNHGIKKITMDGIARHLSISKKTIYKEFNDKNEIVVEICKLDVKQHHKSLTLIQSKATNAIDAIVQIMNYVSKYLDSVNPSYFYDMNKYHPLAWNVFKQFKLSYVMNSVKEMLHRGQNEELFRTDFNIDIIAKLRIVEMDA
ncbi:MAG: TetR/AcrR family transcriptional regulator, partial [Bacteroidia bacterium]|nr:TetR/AcrR family transcriptional regulator [Bacteroidia bacterium]